MRMSAWAKIAALFVLAFAFLSAGLVVAQQGRIGVAALVKNQVFGNSQPLSDGASVFANERIRTGEASTAQLQFVDQTNLSIGPKSELVLDRFVFDPNRGKGNVVVQTGRGAFRWVSGSQDPTSYQIRTPVATIGVRGTVFNLANGLHFSIIGLISGQLQITNLVTGQTFTLNPGWTVVIYTNGQMQQFQSSDTMQTAVQQIDPILTNEFQELLTSLTFLNTLGNSFTPPPD
ncbi:MAG TPA: FecR domain-containing protein [Xanthobacteraceae bacterium]|nr:FecR domain-containing protein [Xanthobacteraceae bacterium]